jgi:glycosyltransferase involved in cell wall biosynthesis
MSESAAPRPAAPNVSVVIPVGRADDLLGVQLRALTAQTYDATFEVVLAVNTADPAEQAAIETMAAEIGIGRTIDASDIRSAAHARNSGAAAAEAPVLAFCDGDDIVEPGWLAALVDALEPGTAIGGHLEEETLAVPGQENWRPPATPGALPTFMGHPYLVSANMACWREDFAATGGFDLALVRGEDIAWSFALTRAGVELRYCADAVVAYRHREGLKAMVHQHYLYGIGMAQVLARIGLPDSDEPAGGALSAFKPNGQKVDQWSIPQVLRKGALGVGRVVGTAQAKLAPVRDKIAPTRDRAAR